MDSLFEVTNEAQLKTMKDEVEREHFRLIEETERKIVEEEMLRLKEKLDLQQREVCQSLMQKNLPYFLDLVQQLEVGLLSHNACSSSSSSLVQGLVEEIKSLGEAYKSRKKATEAMNILAERDEENRDPKVNNYNNDSDAGKRHRFEGFECSPLEKEVYRILKEANGVVHERMESAYGAFQRSETQMLDNHKKRNPQKALEAVWTDMEKAKALCKRNLQAAVDIACGSTSTRCSMRRL